MLAIKRICFSAALFVLALLPGAASAECKPFPKHPLWKTLTHERANNYVKRKLKGDWTPYTNHLDNQLAAIMKIMTAGKSARIRHRGKIVTFSEAELADYYEASKARLKVVQCLAEESLAAKLDSFMTAAGDEEPDTEFRVNPLVSGVASTALKIDVSTTCENGVSTFRIRNSGTDWPKSGDFSIYRIDGATKNSVSMRRMRLKSGQSASFTVKKSRNPTGNLGLFVGPTWYKRAFTYDATLNCS